MRNRRLWTIIGIALAVVLILVGVLLQTATRLDLSQSGDRARGWFADGIWSSGVFSAGIFSVGVYSIGVFSIGIFSLGLFSIGVFSLGIFAIGVWVAAQYALGKHIAKRPA